MAQSRPTVDAATDFNIPARDLAGALDRFSTQTGIQVVYQPELVASRQSKALTGRLTWRQALEALLQGSGLEYQQADDTTVVIRRQGNTRSPAAARPAAAATQAAPAGSEGTEVTELGRMMVTGTRIRGGVTPSPVIGISAAQIQEEGFADLGEVIRSVPQNFSGGQNPGVALGAETGAGGNANQNITGGSSLNLRGLGPDATLMLLNGRRMAYGGFSQTVDISVIPVEAVERIEIVADGASAIYGSDAVGGVGNVILKRDFDGFALGVRYGTATDGGLTTREYTATAGTTWSSGGLLATYKDASTDPIYARQREYTANHMPEPATIYPGGDVHSGLFSIHQSLGELVELRLDALRTRRDQAFNMTDPTYYYIVAGETTSSLVAPAIEFSLPNDWVLSIMGALGKDEHTRDVARATHGTEALTRTQNDCWCNRSEVYEASAEGPLFEMGGGDARLAVGAGHRSNDFMQFNHLTNTTTIQGSESSRFAYAEINLPLVGPDSNIGGVRRLVMTGAMRGEDYDTFGSVTTPKLGLIYGPNADFTLKASWGKSFKAPTLNERFWARQAVLYPAAWLGGTDYPPGSTVLGIAGGNPDLDAERARTWSASIAFHPEAIHGLEMELSWFDIDYTDRVVQPIANFSQALNIPEYAEFIRLSPTPQEQDEAIAAADLFLNATGTPYDPGNVVAIAYPRFTNTSWQRIKGLDLSGSYRFGLASGQMTIRGSASFLDSSQQTSSAALPFDLAGRLFYPAKVNSRLGAVWYRAGFMASTFANYTSGVTNPANGMKGGSFTTFDATLRYSTSQPDASRSGWDFSLSLQNLLDRAPPLFAADGIGWAISAPYDSTNYSAVGRFLSLSVARRW
ncbi:TonB-dependent receptor [Pseudothauera nasutitermitis]|uniref:TonB-dependent receptor n=2 Tax=Pseudothauera nasutitermitis TaxID=2565930 RepID=A0A4S4AY11_9RHOO|nr:TonB-dependent receptor [Pseudothauera nasutitermitis]